MWGAPQEVDSEDGARTFLFNTDYFGELKVRQKPQRVTSDIHAMPCPSLTLEIAHKEVNDKFSFM